MPPYSLLPNCHPPFIHSISFMLGFRQRKTSTLLNFSKKRCNQMRQKELLNITIDKLITVIYHVNMRQLYIFQNMDQLEWWMSHTTGIPEDVLVTVITLPLVVHSLHITVDQVIDPLCIFDKVDFDYIVSIFVKKEYPYRRIKV